MNIISIQLIPGAVLKRPKAAGLVEHEGLYLGNGLVFHNTPARGDHISTLADFSLGQSIRIHQTDQHLVPATLIRAQQLAWVNRRYHVANYNCQHSVRKALGRAVESPQVQGWALTSLALLALAATR